MGRGCFGDSRQGHDVRTSAGDGEWFLMETELNFCFLFPRIPFSSAGPPQRMEAQAQLQINIASK